MVGVLTAAILCGAFGACCISLSLRQQAFDTRLIGTPLMITNTPSGTANTHSVTDNPPTVPNNTPSVTYITPVMTNNTPSGTANTYSVTDIMHTGTDNMPSVTNNTPSMTNNTPSMTANTADTPSVTANTPPVTSKTLPVTSNALLVPTNTPLGNANTNSVTDNTHSVTDNAPSVTSNTPPVTSNTPFIITNTPSGTASTNSVTDNTHSMTDNTPSVMANTPWVTADMPSETADSTLEPPRLRGLRTHVEGDRIVYDLNEDFLLDCVKGKTAASMAEAYNGKEFPRHAVYLPAKDTFRAPFRKGTLRVDIHVDYNASKARAQGNDNEGEHTKRCRIALTAPEIPDIWDFVFTQKTMMIKILNFEVSSQHDNEHGFRVSFFISDMTYEATSYDRDLERPRLMMYRNDPLFLDVVWLVLPETFTMEMDFVDYGRKVAPWKLNLTLTSPMAGIVRTPFWDGHITYDIVSLFHTNYGQDPSSDDDTAMIRVPDDHAVMISWEHIGTGDSENCQQVILGLTEDLDSIQEARVLPYSICGVAAIPPPMLLPWTRVRLVFTIKKANPNSLVTGVSLRFSFHNASARPQQLEDKTWNCSVAHWTDFKLHLLCDLITQCAGYEDESDCPYSPGTYRPGYLAAGGSLFTFHLLPDAMTTWTEAEVACRSRGGRLPTMNTPAKWRAVLDLLSHRGWDNIYIGLSHSTLPDLYSQFLQWSDLSVAYYTKAEFLVELQCGICAFLRSSGRPGILYMDSCGKKVAGSLLCEVERPSHMGAITIATAHTLHHGINSTRCPKGHVTHNFLSCDPRSDCLERCYTFYSAHVTSHPPAFTCRNGIERVPFTLVCDHREDCTDASDEICVFPTCQEVECTNKQCIALRKKCDGVKDCLDGSDEQDCSKLFRSFSVLNLDKPLPAMVLHDGKGFYDLLDIDDPSAQSTSSDNRSTTEGCPDSHFLCPGVSYYCLPTFVRCNGVYDCPGHEDEVDCDTFQCPGFYRCRGSKVCVHGNYLCDGVFLCPQRDDELMCGFVCPVGCTCYGLAFFCTIPFEASRHVELKFLDVSGSGMSLKGLSNNTLLFYLSLAKCNITQLETLNFVNVFHLDLSENSITTITEKHISSCQNLQVFILAGNPLRTILEDASPGHFAKLHTLDLSAVSITAPHLVNLQVFQHVTNLNLSNTRLDAVSGFSAFRHLQMLDLRGCPVTYFTRSVFQGLGDLNTLYADNYKLCCQEILPDGFNVLNCQAPFDEVSSCEGLLKSGLYRVGLSVLSSMTLIGNAGSFIYRVLINRPKRESSFGLFVTNLCVSDFLMGVYSAIIGIADRIYLGNYVWNDVTWRKSVMCKMAGVLSLVSNEVSVLIICLITVDRFLVTRFPLSQQLHFSLRSARVACISAWSVGILLAVTPLLPVTSHWQLYSQTGICIPLPVTRIWFAGREYSFGILIILNFMLFLVIASGQLSIYLSVKANSMTTSDTTQKAKDFTVARRLITVAVSDFLCWFPVGLLGMLSSRGQPIPGEASVVIAVFVLPLNSALNPFLYTVNVILERRQRASEQRLQKIILARHAVATARQEGGRSK